MSAFLCVFVAIGFFVATERGPFSARAEDQRAVVLRPDPGTTLTLWTIRLVTMGIQALWLYTGFEQGFADLRVVVPVHLALALWNLPGLSAALAARLLPLRLAFGVIALLAPGPSREGPQGGAVLALLGRRALSSPQFEFLKRRIHSVIWPGGLHVLALAALREAREGPGRGDPMRALLVELPEPLVGGATRELALLQRMGSAWAAGDPLRAARLGLRLPASGAPPVPLPCELVAVAITTTLLGGTPSRRRLAMSRPLLAWRLRPGLRVLAEGAAKARASDDLLERARGDEILGLCSRLPAWAREDEASAPRQLVTLPDEEPVLLARRLHGALLARRAPTARQLSLVAESWDRVRHDRALLARLEQELAGKRSPTPAAELLAGALSRVEEELARVLVEHDLEVVAPGATLDKARRRACEEQRWVAARRAQDLRRALEGRATPWTELWERWADTCEALTRAARLGDEGDRVALAESCAGPLLAVARGARDRADTQLLGASVLQWMRHGVVGYSSWAMRDAIITERHAYGF